MNFLVDAHLPRRLAELLQRRGHGAVHTSDLPAGNRTTDTALCALADATDAAVMTKDADFVVTRVMKGSPRRLVVIATGNVGNRELLALIEANLPAVLSALVEPAHLELSRTTLIVHD